MESSQQLYAVAVIICHRIGRLAGSTISIQPMKVCIYGGQYGSEGKGSVAEWYIKHRRSSLSLVVSGENAPNSGHTCSAGKTRNIPSSSFFADAVLLGPDSVVNLEVLMEDIEQVRKYRVANGMKGVQFFIHDNAGVMNPRVDIEGEAQVVADISSTGSGSGQARIAKYFHRRPDRIIGNVRDEVKAKLMEENIILLNRNQYLSFIDQHSNCDWLFECSQGLLLDPNWGIFPYVTSRSTLPMSAVARNGLDKMLWDMVGVFRTYPIRTGGPSGPTGAKEITFESINQPNEIATVTKRVRRLFDFSLDDFILSYRLVEPEILMFTHADYLNKPFIHWFRDIGLQDYIEQLGRQIGYSTSPGKFTFPYEHID